MLQGVKASWQAFKQSPPGERFMRFYERQHEHRTRAQALLYPLAALVSFAIGVVLVFIPGPAVVFFALTAALLAAQSQWLSQQLDRAELALRKLWRRRRLQHNK